VGRRLVKDMFHRAIISAMAVSPEDIAAGALALQVFVKNARNVEIIVDVAFAVIPTVLGIGAAGLLGSGIINTAKEVRNSVSLLRTLGTGILYGGYGLNVLRTKVGERWRQSNIGLLSAIGKGLIADELIKSKFKKRQDTQSKQDGQDSGGGGGNPPTPPDKKSDKKENPPPPPDKKSDKKEERPKPTGIDAYSPISIPNPFKKKK
jgi:hypothetical protein